MTNLANSVVEGKQLPNPTSPKQNTSPERPIIIIPKKKNFVHNIGDLIEKHKHFPEPKHLWRGVLEKSFGYIFGAPKSGKSSLCECLAIHIAAGRDSFLGTSLQANGPVLYINLEESERSRLLRNRMQIQSLSQTEIALFYENFKTLDDDFPMSVNTDDDWNLLRENITLSKANIVIIDSLTHLCPGRIEDSTEAQKIVLKLKEIVKDLDVTLICIHHTPKNNEKPLTIESLAGSRVLGQGAEFMIGVKSINTQRYIKDVAYRHSTCEEEVLCFEITQSREIKIIGTANEFDILPEPGKSIKPKSKSKSNEDIVLDYLRTSGKTPGAKLVIEFDTLQNIMAKATVYNCLNRLLEAGKIEKDEDGNFFCSIA